MNQNEEVSEKKCKDLLTTLSAVMCGRLQKGSYSKPGGYKEYQEDMKIVTESYKEQALNSVKVIYIKY